MLYFNLMTPAKQNRKSRHEGNARLTLLFRVFVVAAVAAVVGSFPLWAASSDMSVRHPDSIRFPMVEETRDEDDILDDYPAYLQFVLEVGSTVNKRSADRLADKYRVLRNYSPKGAAKFLRGLRFEMVQKLQYAHMSPRAVNSSNPKIRAWVKRHLDKWYQEADEFLFRAVVYKKTGARWY